MEALFCSYFFPLQFHIGGIAEKVLGKGKKLAVDARILYWSYAFWLYWCTMYLMHHYLVDLVGGGCLATLCFYRELSWQREEKSPIQVELTYHPHPILTVFLDDTQRHYMEEYYPVNPSQPAPFSTLQASHSHLHLTPSRQVEEFSLDPLRATTKPPDEEERGGGESSSSNSNAHSNAHVNPTLFSVTEEDDEEAKNSSRAATPRPSAGRQSSASASAANAAAASKAPASAPAAKKEDRDSFDDWD